MRVNDYRQAGETTAGFGIKAKLLFGFSVIIVTFFISVLASLYLLADMHGYADKFSKTEIPLAHELSDFEGLVVDSQTSILGIILLRDTKARDRYDESWLSINGAIALIDGYGKQVNDQVFFAKWNELKQVLAKLKKAQLDAINATAGTDENSSLAIYKSDVLPLYMNVLGMLNKNSHDKSIMGLLDDRSNVMIENIRTILDDIQSLKWTIIFSLIACIILSIIIALRTAGSILRPMHYAIDIAGEIASGNRNVMISVHSRDETASLLSSLDRMQSSIKASEEKLKEKAAETRTLFDSIVQSANQFSVQTSRVAAGDLTMRLALNEGDSNQVMVKLGSDLNQMTDNLSSIAKEITSACINMVSTLDEVRHSVDSQSSGATEQATSINEITASISEIEKSAAQTMVKAKSLGEVATKTREKGQLGLDAVEQSIAGMKAVRDRVQTIAQTILDLSRQTQQVGEITIVVNNLAQQSKMLALNASIEAAKAGEAGKGFAVVANEVKNLAEQSEQSTSQVQKILEDIKLATEKAVMVTEEGTKGVDMGMTLIEQTGNIIRGLNDVIHETSIATQQIEAAIRQESSGIEQINAGMNEINQVTATFVDSVRETTEAMNSLAKIAQNLKVSVDTYKV